MEYRMPAEWELHEGTWLAWPHNTEHWPGKFAPIPCVYTEIVYALIEASEKVFICVNDGEAEEQVQNLLIKACKMGEPSKLNDVFFFHIPTDGSWLRDCGPIFVKDPEGTRFIIDWIYNAWGGKYPPWNKDDKVPQKISELLGIPIIQPGIVLEGGSIDVNGKGTLITTEQCLLNKNRNPHLNQKQIEKYLQDYLGATNVLWLKEGIIGDDTDGHIDNIARFIDSHTILCVREENHNDGNYEILKKNFEELKRMRDQDGKLFQVIPLPMPDPVIYEKQRLPASYANFYIANRAVLVPTFQNKHDEEVLKIFSELFPTRKIIGIDCIDLVWGLGAIHCSLQQQPA